MEVHYPKAKYPQHHPPAECTLSPGELLYFPDHWWHATINLDVYTVFVSTFTQEHQADRYNSGTNVLVDEL